MARRLVNGVDGKPLSNGTNIDTLTKFGIYFIESTTSLDGTLPPLLLSDLGSRVATLYVDTVYENGATINRQIWTHPTDTTTNDYYRLKESDVWTTWTSFTSGGGGGGDVFFSEIKGKATDNTSINNTLAQYIKQTVDNGQSTTGITSNGTLIELVKSDGGGDIKISSSGVDITGTKITANGVEIPQTLPVVPTIDATYLQNILKPGTNVDITKSGNTLVISSLGGSGGATQWGNIVGTIANQADLAPYIESLFPHPYPIVDTVIRAGDNISFEKDSTLGHITIKASGQLSSTVNWGDILGSINSQSDLVAYVAEKANTSSIYTRLNNALVAGDGIELTPDAGAGTITIKSTGDSPDYYFANIKGTPSTNQALVDYINTEIDLGIASTVNGSFMNHVLSAGSGITFTYDDVSHRIQISATGSSSGGSIPWGSISGSVSNQTDLVNYIYNNRYQLSGFDMFNHIRGGSNIGIGLDPQTGDVIVNYTGSGGGGTTNAQWGAITGDITNQTDLVSYVQDRIFYNLHESRLIHRFEAGQNVMIDGDPDINVIRISATGSVTSTLWGGLGGDIENQTDLTDYIKNHKYNSDDLMLDLVAGNNIVINQDVDNKKVIISASGGGGGGTSDVLWGAITGNVQNQIDLTMYISGVISSINGQFINSRLIAGNNIDLALDPQTGNVVVSAQAQITSSVPWGGITGDIESQLDLDPYVKDEIYKYVTGSFLGSFFTAGQNIKIDKGASGMTISAQDELPVGGTTGQILVKKSDADFDLSWATAPSVLPTAWKDLTGKPDDNDKLVSLFEEKENIIKAGNNINITRTADNTATINAIVSPSLISSSLEAGANIEITYDAVNDKAKISATSQSTSSVTWGSINGTLTDQSDLSAYINNATSVASTFDKLTAGDNIKIQVDNNKIKIGSIPYSVVRDDTLVGAGITGDPLKVSHPFDLANMKEKILAGDNIVITSNEQQGSITITSEADFSVGFSSLTGLPEDNLALKGALNKKIERIVHDETLTGSGTEADKLHAVIPTTHWSDIVRDDGAEDGIDNADLKNCINKAMMTRQLAFEAKMPVIWDNTDKDHMYLALDQEYIENTYATRVANLIGPYAGSELDQFVDLKLTDYQRKLTAGQNITIVGNVISASGGLSSVSWGDITGDPIDNTDLVEYIKTKLNDYQPKLTAGANITIDSNNTISATKTTSLAWDAITGQPTENQVLVDYITSRLPEANYTAGDSSITISSDRKITATHQAPTGQEVRDLLTAGTSIELNFDIASGKTIISATAPAQQSVNWQDIVGDPANSSSLTTYINSLITGDITPEMILSKLEAGSNVQLLIDASSQKVQISATNTTYTAGDNITITGTTISAPAPTTSLDWTAITGTPTSNTALNTVITNINNAIDGKQGHLTAGANITISDQNVISATQSDISFGDVKGNPQDNTNLTTYLGNTYYTKAEVDQLVANAVANAMAGITSQDGSIGVVNS